MKIFSSSHEFDYSWDEVSIANWRKYCSWNNRSTHVIGVDILDRRLDPATNILRTERLITCHQGAPKWIQPFLGGTETSLVFEVSYVDPAAKRVTMCSQNLTWSELLSVQETVVYRPNPTTPGRTIFDQNAKIVALCGGWQRIKNKIEDFTVERFSQNAVKGREGFERVLAISREAFAEQRREQNKGTEQQQQQKKGFFA